MSHFLGTMGNVGNLLAEIDPAAGAVGLGFLMMGFICVGALIGLGIAVLVCWYLSSCLARVPAPYRKQDPNMVWLLLIPIFNIVWNFFVYPKIADSYKAYFNAQGRTDVGDCGRGIAMGFCICACICALLSIVPFINVIAFLAMLVLWIIFLVKVSGYKNQIPATPIGV